MKVMFSHGLPFSLAHGGLQTLIESLMRELSALGVEVEPERWWDPTQTCDIQHFVQRPHLDNARLAKQKGRKTIMTENFDVIASESQTRLFMRACATRVARTVLPGFDGRLSFYRHLDALVYVVPHEWDVVRQIYRLPPDRGFIVPHGLDRSAIEALAAPQPERDYLVSVGTVCPRKNTVLLALCARKARVPVIFIGKPFSDQDPYFLRFRELIDNKYVQYIGYVRDEVKYRILGSARGFVLLSRGESGCIAVHEAAAAGLPLLLSKLPWAAKAYPRSDGIYLTRLRSVTSTAQSLRRFYESAHRASTMTFQVRTWNEIAQMYVAIYRKMSSECGSAPVGTRIESFGERNHDLSVSS